MQGAQNKKKTPGAFKSCLIPYQEQIFTWWYDDRLSAVEIQKLLQTKFGIEVHRSTLARFIKVRRDKPDPHQRPAHLMPTSARKAPVKSTTSPKRQDPGKSAAPVIPPEPGEPINPDSATGDDLLKYLEDSTPQALGRAAAAAKKKKK